MRVPVRRLRSAVVAAAVAVGGCDPGGGVLNPRPEDPGAASLGGGGAGAASGTGGGDGLNLGAGGASAGPSADAGVAYTPPPTQVPGVRDGGVADGSALTDAWTSPRRD